MTHAEPIRHAVSRYPMPAILLHWLHALAIVLAFALGIVFHELPESATRHALEGWHHSAGIGVLGIATLRLLWRLIATTPDAVPMPLWQARLARLAHRGLYLLFFAVPLAGWACSSAAGQPVVVLRRLTLPDWVVASDSLAEVLKPVHATLAYALAALVMVHVAATLKHQLIDRDGLLRRMLP